MLYANGLQESLGFSHECNCLFLQQGHQANGLFSTRRALSAHIHTVSRYQFVAFASQRSDKKVKKISKKSKTRKLLSDPLPLDDNADFPCESLVQNEGSFDTIMESSSSRFDGNSLASSASRSDVLKACIITSGLLLALGLVIRQVSHVLSIEGWPILDSKEILVSFEVWHLELIIGLVILISSSRYVLLKTWPDFAESSEAANQQVLSFLQPLDYIVVAFLPGISEELLFRGALMPIFGLNWTSAFAVGVVFGLLHLGSGRRFSFAIWATFVGFVYGLAAIFSSSMVVPMASHSLNNLIGGILWRYTSIPQKET